MEYRTQVGLTKYIVVLAIAAVAVVAVHAVLLGGLSRVGLGSADPLTGQVSQALGTDKSNSALLEPNADFTLSDVSYFENKSWVVATIVPKNSDLNQSTVIMHKNGDIFVPVRGPGTAFTPNEVQDLPSDVTDYVTSKGLIYVPVLN